MLFRVGLQLLEGDRLAIEHRLDVREPHRAIRCAGHDHGVVRLLDALREGLQQMGAFPLRLLGETTAGGDQPLAGEEGGHLLLEGVAQLLHLLDEDPSAAFGKASRMGRSGCSKSWT